MYEMRVNSRTVSKLLLHTFNVTYRMELLTQMLWTKIQSISTGQHQQVEQAQLDLGRSDLHEFI